jgi:hypothetical protein
VNSQLTLNVFKKYADWAIQYNKGWIGASGFADELTSAGLEDEADPIKVEGAFIKCMSTIGCQGYEFEGPHGRDGYNEFVVSIKQMIQPHPKGWEKVT